MSRAPPGRPCAAGHVTALPAVDPTAAARGAEGVGAGDAAPGRLATSAREEPWKP